VRDRTGAGTLEGSLRTPLRDYTRGDERRQAVADRYSGAPAATRKNAGRQSAREEVGRNPGPGCRERTLEGSNPGEPPAVEVLNPRSVARDFREVKPRNRGLRGRPSAWQVVPPAGGTVRGSRRYGNVRRPRGGRKLRRVNPRSAAGVKESRRGIEGRKPSRGSPNPEGGTKRAGKAREMWTFGSSCAEGSKSP
jgi:hypothetical protein